MEGGLLWDLWEGHLSDLPVKRNCVKGNVPIGQPQGSPPTASPSGELGVGWGNGPPRSLAEVMSGFAHVSALQVAGHTCTRGLARDCEL